VIVCRVLLTIGAGETFGTVVAFAIPEVGAVVDVELDAGGTQSAIVERVLPGDDPYAATLICSQVEG
jgi:hypothetical protein